MPRSTKVCVSGAAQNRQVAMTLLREGNPRRVPPTTPINERRHFRKTGIGLTRGDTSESAPELVRIGERTDDAGQRDAEKSRDAQREAELFQRVAVVVPELRITPEDVVREIAMVAIEPRGQPSGMLVAIEVCGTIRL